jgi:hypothetical protein
MYGPENAIVHGGHFYSTSLMQTTLQSMIHTFVINEFISNTFHHPSHKLLRHIIIFWGLAIVEDRLTTEGKPEDALIAHAEEIIR